MDDPLGHGVAGGRLGAKEEGAGRDGQAGIVPQLLVEVDDVQHVEKLALVLVEPLDLHVEDGVGVQHGALLALGPAGEGCLVLRLDLLQPLQHGAVAGKGVELLQLLGVQQPAVSDGVMEQAGKAGVDLGQPAAVVDAVGDVLELLRLHLRRLPEHVVAQNIGVEGADAVNGHAAGDAQVGHAHVAIPNDCHLGGLGAVVIVFLDLRLIAAGDLLDDLPHAGQQRLHQALGPDLQRLGQHGVVGIGHGVGGDVPRLIPAHAGVVDQNAHQLRDHQCRVGIVDLDNVFLVEVLQRAVGLDMLAGDGLDGGADEEILLLEPQGLALVVVILRIEHLGNGVRHGPLLVGLEILAPVEEGHVHRPG